MNEIREVDLTDAQRLVHCDSEFAMLTDFYNKWEVFHGTSRDRLHRRDLERAAQDLVDAANVLRRCRGVKAEMKVKGRLRVVVS